MSVWAFILLTALEMNTDLDSADSMLTDIPRSLLRVVL
jgi:hypothetical protein